jgi:outer membrane protein TolC
MRILWSRAAAALALALLCAPHAHAQISLSTAVNLALENNPKVRMAQADLDRASAVLTQTHAAYIPAVSATGGVGKATGAPLSPPVVFSIAAESLVFSFSQPDYIRAARAGVTSAQLALQAARSDTAEDAINTYIALDNALRREAVETGALTIASRLVSIEQDRFSAGVDPHIELTKALRTQTQIRLQLLLVQDEIAAQAAHLASLTALPATGLQTVASSIPTPLPPASAPTDDDATDASRDQGISAAFASAQARQDTARGDARYMLRPQIAFSANYSRISTAFTTYTAYYPQFGAAGNSLNSLGIGVQITLPILDMVHRAKARESAADAVHALAEAHLQQIQFLEGRHKLQRSTAELAARAQLASLDHDLAQDQLDAIRIQLRASAATAQGQQLTPRDETNAELDVRQKQLDMLNSELQLRQAEVNLMRQHGSLNGWLGGALPSASTGTHSPSLAIPPTTGREPSTSAPIATPAPTPPTTGTPPASLPQSPDTHPAPRP